MSFRYFAFGVHLESDRAVPGLAPAASRGASDVWLWLGVAPAWLAELEASAKFVTGLGPDHSGGITLETLGEFFRLRFKDGTEFFFDRLGTQIWATWPEPLTLEDTATYLLGPVFSLVLRFRGTISLHASAIRIGDVAIALVGPQGSGKSTTAASFATAGYSVLTDDCAPIRDCGDAFQIIPAYPRIRLWPESVEMLFGSPDALPRITPTWDKCYLELGNNVHRFEPEPAPLAAIYFLHPRTIDPPAPVIDPEPRRDGLVKLIGNSGGNVTGQGSNASTFDLLGRLAQSVHLRRLIPHTDPRYLPQLRDMVVADIRALHPGACVAAESRHSPDV
ncbi:MAG: hypothetical protein ACR2JJ_02850 [Sphingomicrobium sp.]